MRRRTHWLTFIIVAWCVTGCSPVPKSICAMPSNARAWQGLTVSWSGKLFDIWAAPHGGGAEFWDERCGRSIKVHTDRPLFAASNKYNHIAMANVHIIGRITYAAGRFWLKPTSVKLLSPWITGQAVDTYVMSGYERRKQQRQVVF